MERVVVNGEFLKKHQACRWYRKFIIKTFPKGTLVTKANVKKLLDAIKKVKDESTNKVFSIEIQQNIFGTCLNYVLYKVKGIEKLASEYQLEKTAFAVLEKRFWELWGKEGGKQTAIEKWIKEVNNTCIASVPVKVYPVYVSKGRINAIELGRYTFNRKDMVELMKLVKWNTPVKKRKR